jgi:spore coat protein A, manganese oxidase
LNRNKQVLTVIIAIFLSLSSILIAFQPAAAAPKANAGLLDPKTIPKYVNQLVANIPVYTPTNVLDGSGKIIEQDYTVHMVALDESILPAGTPLVGGNGLTHVWGYSGLTNVGQFANSPSATFMATTGIPSKVKWVNDISEPEFLPVDPTIMWADPTNPMASMMRTYPAPYPVFQGATTTFTATMGANTYQVQTQIPAPLVPHLHGAEVQSFSDGGPNAWFTYDGKHGSTYSTYEDTASNAAVYYYPNAQNPTTLWYHDHAMGMTRLNVMSGLAGFYLLKDPAAATTITTPASTGADFDQYMNQHFTYGVNEIPLAIQDRSFYADGRLWFPTVGINPTIHPYWMPEFFGNTVMVNGKVWPNLDVTQGVYRFRVLDGSNARFYTLSFDNKMPFTVIGTEGGYLQQPATVTSLTIAPGERYDIIVDFSKVAVGSKIIMTNTAKAPFPNGATADPQTTGQVMQFTVAGTAAAPGNAVNNVGATTLPTYPTTLNPTLPVGTFPTLPAATLPRRYITLVEIMGPAGPQMVTMNGQLFEGVVTETPKQGTEEEWVIINLTADTHPIHTHLASFQLLSRQTFQATKYMKDWMTLNGNQMLPFPVSYAPTPLPPTAYLQQKPKAPLPTEMGWKDTVQMNPGEVTIIRIRFTQQDGLAFPFDASEGPGYVWHCHIVDHEDNEMMRPYTVERALP